MNSHKTAFIEYEADNYFLRNQSMLKNYSVENDLIVKLLKEYDLIPRRILEIGCNAGYRLNGFLDIFTNSEVYGIEPSKLAIDYGKKHYNSKINFIQGTADEMSCFEDNYFDLVIVGFVFYVIDRNLLLKTIGEVDRVIENKGALINIDFYATFSHKNPYKHIENNDSFVYKQNYEDIFLASKLYQLVDKRSFNHNTKFNDASIDFNNKMVISLLLKELNAGYES